jgi:hypothetical protein
MAHESHCGARGVLGQAAASGDNGNPAFLSPRLGGGFPPCEEELWFAIDGAFLADIC